jgi:hypothetical protein
LAIIVPSEIPERIFSRFMYAHEVRRAIATPGARPFYGGPAMLRQSQ